MSKLWVVGRAWQHPPPCPENASQPTGRLWPQPSDSAAPLGSCSWDLAPPHCLALQLVPISCFLLCVQLGARVSAAACTPGPILSPKFRPSSLPAQTIPSANVTEHQKNLTCLTHNICCCSSGCCWHLGQDTSPMQGLFWALQDVQQYPRSLTTNARGTPRHCDN